MTSSETAALSPDDDALRVACLREGVHDAEAGRLEDAETRFREVLESVRGSGGKAERLAVSSLMTLFAREGRDAEALILARRHLALASSGGDPEDLCFAYAALTDALARLEDWRRLDPALDDFEQALDAYDGRHHGGLLRHLLRTCIHRELARGGVAAAASFLARIRVLDATEPDPSDLVRATLRCEAELGLATGCPERAREALARIPDGDASPEVAFLAARCTLAIEGRGATVAALGRVADALESPAARREGVASRLTVARRAADLAERTGAPFELTRRTFDVAAAMVILRASEIERAAREMPELAVVDPQDERALAAYRIHFAAEQKELLAAVADLLRRRAAAGELPSWAHGAGDGAVQICPWCLRVRTPDGALLPIGHYVPSGSGLTAQHGACGACAGRLRPV